MYAKSERSMSSEVEGSNNFGQVRLKRQRWFDRLDRARTSSLRVRRITSTQGPYVGNSGVYESSEEVVVS